MLNDVDQAAFDKIEKKMDFVGNMNFIMLCLLVLDVILYLVFSHYGYVGLKHACAIINNCMTFVFISMIIRIEWLKGKRNKILERV